MYRYMYNGRADLGQDVAGAGKNGGSYVGKGTCEDTGDLTATSDAA
jgi:hypothetical protein